MSEHSKINVDDFKSRLLAHREEVLSDEEAGEHTRPSIDLDPAREGRLSRMDAIQGAALADETERRRKVELVRIDAALRRIEDGEFGFCVSCGEEIARRRLESDPAIPTCIGCASNADHAH